MHEGSEFTILPGQTAVGRASINTEIIGAGLEAGLTAEDVAVKVDGRHVINGEDEHGLGVTWSWSGIPAVVREGKAEATLVLTIEVDEEGVKEGTVINVGEIVATLTQTAAGDQS